MSAPELGRAFAFDPEAPADSRRAGLARLMEAAPGSEMEPEDVWAVCEMAWDPMAEFDPRPHPAYPQVLALADEVNGYGWSEYVLVDWAARFEAFAATRKALVEAMMAGTWGGLTPADREEAVDKALARTRTRLLVAGEWRNVQGWDVRGVAREYVGHEMRTAWEREMRRRRAPRGGHGYWTSLEAALEFGDHYMSNALPDVEVGVDSVSLVDAVWASAHRHLEDRAPDLVAAARAGAPRRQAEIKVAAALDVLAAGAAEDGEDLRRDFVEDARSVTWKALRRAAPATHGRYGEAVPTPDAILAMAAETARLGDPDAAWFGALDGRRQDVVATSRGILHLVIGLVRSELGLAEGCRVWR